MKKILLIAAAACFVMTSCKKDYTCECVDSDRTNPDDFNTKYTKVKKKDAEASCKTLNDFWSPDWTCTLK